MSAGNICCNNLMNRGFRAMIANNLCRGEKERAHHWRRNALCAYNVLWRRLLVIIITNSANTRVLADLVIMITNKNVYPRLLQAWFGTDF